ncbi:MAG: ferric reductase-like transmembrane domain-containing protein [Gaiellaceae bacterium]
MIGATGPTTLWYLSRGTGVVSLVLLTAAVVLGVAGSLRARPRVLLAGLHRNLPLLAIAFVVAHVLTTVADGYAPIGVKDAVFPFLSPYRPVWLGLGTVAFDLLLALVATSLLRARIGLRGWRAVHWLAYLSWPVAVMHGLGTGSDGKSGWLLALTVACTLAVAASVVMRVLQTPGVDGGRRLVALGAVPAVLLALFVWAKTGPLQRGWSLRAGTPAALIPAVARSPIPTRAVQRRAPATPLPYTATVSGSLSQSQSNSSGIATVQIEARTAGPIAGRLRATLYGIPLENGGLSMQSSDVAYATAGSPAAYRGPVTALAGTHITAVVADATGRHLRLDLDLRIDASSGSVGGTLRVHHSGTGRA